MLLMKEDCWNGRTAVLASFPSSKTVHRISPNMREAVATEVICEHSGLSWNEKYRHIPNIMTNTALDIKICCAQLPCSLKNMDITIIKAQQIIVAIDAPLPWNMYWLYASFKSCEVKTGLTFLQQEKYCSIHVWKHSPEIFLVHLSGYASQLMLQSSILSFCNRRLANVKTLPVL
jgi:hypothetical protein